MSDKSEFDAYRTTYKETVNQAISFSGLDVDFFTKVKAVRLVDLLRDRLGDPLSLSILDVGCGVGTYHPLLRGKVRKITGIDLSEECLEEGRANNTDVDYRHYDGLRMPFPDNSFDAAFAICVMHHVPPEQWPSFSREMVRVTRPGGLVVIFEHNPYNPFTRRAVNTCPFDADAVLLTKSQTTTHFKSAGLKDVEGRYILSVPAMKGLPRSLDDLLGALPIGAQYFVSGRP
ncbi:Methyltransferase domain-containing protein [Phyllobacterium sp. YR620]|uniref:Class I SAM-dependent methyltransferase n=1 Tax=Phyllobacterium pellucidum TaxID=2740464 RepID=A0A849VRW3_9HYPH|nr:MULTISPECIES: class I SAM-dependent methyltransferase [Phyllobacterium]NTS30623.1 class I SAM-dependent methyltransferase [Phyllobacterium pellucidum]UGY10668.1 class I SAM-dependent methyltransferase [Phyllobacterium sp. T1018]SDP78138.1 Methyltransferase domain-containing protein [Phyllobacterium sp. YR620]